MAERRITDREREQVAEQVRQVWWVRCLLESEHDPVLGPALRSVFGMQPVSPPWFGPSAIIDQAGFVLTNYVDKDNRSHFAATICHIDDLVANLRRLAGALQLSDQHTKALFDQTAAWITSDARPHTEQAEDRIPEADRTVH